MIFKASMVSSSLSVLSPLLDALSKNKQKNVQCHFDSQMCYSKFFGCFSFLFSFFYLCPFLFFFFYAGKIFIISNEFCNEANLATFNWWWFFCRSFYFFSISFFNCADSKGVEAFAICKIDLHLGASLNLVGAGAGTSPTLS